MKSKVYTLVALLILAGSFVSWRQASARITPLAAETIETERPDGTNRVKLSGSQFFASAGLPRNGRIAFSAPSSGGEHIFSIDAQGGSRLQLTTEGSVNKFPAWSLDGATIVFSSNRTGMFELWTMRAGGGAQTQIRTDLPGGKFIPQLSPDGTTIVFTYHDPAIGHPEVWSISANGGNARKLTTTPKAATGPTWSLLPHFSPDGRRIVYASTKSGSSQIWIMNADGSGQTQVTRGFGAQFPDANAPKWSPDGSKIAFWSGFETQYGEVWTMRADGTDARQLTDQPGTISSDNPAWSPDGTKLLFDTNRQISPQIWVMNADGSDQHLLVDIGIGNTQFSWQPLPQIESEGLIALADVDGSQAPPIPRHQIFTMRPDGTNRVQLTRDGGPQFYQNWMPAWSPDGTKIAYVHHTTNGLMSIRVMDDDGGNPRTLTTSGVSLAPVWSPDGATIAYAHKATNTPIGVKLWLMNADGTNQRALTTGPDNIDENVPTWSPDGKKIAFTSNREGGKYRIWVINKDGSNPVALTTAYFDTTLQADIEQKVPAWSPDGKYIAYWQGVEGNDPRPNLPRDVWVMRADGGDQRKLVPGDDPAWSPDSATISHPDFSTGKLAVGGISPDGSNKRILFFTNGSFARLSWRPATLSQAVANVSAASYISTSLAPESIVSAFGSGLATSTLAASSTPLPTTLAGTMVKVRDSAGTERLAPLFFVSPAQINYQIPATTATGAATITVTSGDGSLSTGSAQIANIAPGLFTANASGQGIAAAIALRIKADGSQSYEPVVQFDPTQNKFVAVPIDLGPETDQVFLLLFGTGIRYRSSLSAVNAQVGATNAQVNFAGAQGSFAGLDQVNARLSRSLIGRGEVDVALAVDGKPANTIKASIK